MVAVGKPLKGMHVTDSLPELILKYQQTEKRKRKYLYPSDYYTPMKN
ncbi:hypothetical protein BFGS084_03749 [Bacteroides fragilis]|nr:hypothetical protein BFGS084_03749 [Bacteroides fragilis]